MLCSSIFTAKTHYKLSDSFDCTRIESIVGESNTRHSVTVSRQNRVYFDHVYLLSANSSSLSDRGSMIFVVIREVDKHHFIKDVCYHYPSCDPLTISSCKYQFTLSKGADTFSMTDKSSSATYLSNMRILS